MLTDGGPPALLQLLAYNAQENDAALDDAAVDDAAVEEEEAQRVEVRPFRWGESLTPLDDVAPSVDLVIASDVTYDDDLHDALCSSLRELLLAGADTRAILCEEHGPPSPLGGDEASSGGLFVDEFLEAFARAANRHGLVVEPFELGEDGSEIELAAARDASVSGAERAWPMSAFADADVFLMEVRLTDVRDVTAEWPVLETDDAASQAAAAPPSPPMLRNRDSWSE